MRPALDQSIATIKGKYILIVEDEAMIALIIEQEILDAGANVVGPAFDLESALDLADMQLDAAVLDINLGGKTVFPAARRLAERGVPFVFASANCHELATNAEFSAYPAMTKPVSMGRLIDALAALIRSDQDQRLN